MRSRTRTRCAWLGLALLAAACGTDKTGTGSGDPTGPLPTDGPGSAEEGPPPAIDTATTSSSSPPVDTGTVPEPRPVLCPPADLELCGNGVDDDGDGATDCAIEGFGAPRAWATARMLASVISEPGDLNQDGVPDLVNYNGSSLTTTGLVLPLQPGVQDAVPYAEVMVSDSYTAYAPLVGDRDADGQVDVVIGLAIAPLFVCDDPRPWAVASLPFPGAGETVDAQTQSHGLVVKPPQLQLSTHQVYVYPAGDIDGDGVLDFSVTVNDCSYVSASSFLVSGAAVVGEVDLAQVSPWVLEPDGSWLGGRTYDVGDLDGDGQDELVWSQYDGAAGAGAQRTRVLVWSTPPTEGVIDPLTADRVIEAPGLVRDIGTEHDLTLDGLRDLVITVDYGSAPGIYVLDGPPLYVHTDLSTQAWSFYAIPDNGESQALHAETGDLNGDGYVDLVMGAVGDGIYVDYAPCVGPRALPADGFLAQWGNGFSVIDADGDGSEDIVFVADDGLGLSVVRGGPRF